MMSEHTDLKFLGCLENNLIILLSPWGKGPLPAGRQGVRRKSRSMESELVSGSVDE